MKCTVNRILTNPKSQWGAYRSSVAGSSRVAFRELKVDWDIYNIKDYLFTHDTIVASVATEPDGFTIRPKCVDLVNDNGNAWTNDVLLHCYKTFIGGENYVGHVQVPAWSKGKILDAVIRKAEHNGEQIYIVDILVATSRVHRQLVDDIESGRMSTLSMGATAKYIQCSVCGRIMDTEKEGDECEHVRDSVGKWVEYKGKKRYCAELCGAMNPLTKEYIPNSCVFIEASWVEQPAFKGAVTNYIIETPEVKAQRMEKNALEHEFDISFNTLRVADHDSQLALRLARRQMKALQFEQTARRLAKKLL